MFIEESSIGNEYYYNNFVNNAMNARVDVGEKELNLFDNYWGTHKEELIAETIDDWYDNQDLAKAMYTPFLTEPYSE